jgi:hypothetical protein
VFPVKYMLRPKKQFRFRNIIHNIAQPDGSKLMYEINDWFALRIKNGLMKEDVVCVQILWQHMI